MVLGSSVKSPRKDSHCLDSIEQCALSALQVCVKIMAEILARLCFIHLPEFN